jgi:hypothetical protein
MKVIVNVLCFFIVGCSYKAPDSINTALAAARFEPLHSNLSIGKLAEEKTASAAKKLASVYFQKADEEIKPSNPGHTNHLQEEAYVGKVKAVIHNFCSPMLDDCESFVVLKYLDQILQVYITFPSFQQFSKNEIAKIGDFIAIDSNTGGSCFDCDGIDVFKLENEKILSLGYFSAIEDEYLIGTYTDLAGNKLTSSAETPAWGLYYTEHKGQITLDADKTCNRSKGSVNYSEKKNVLLSVINSKKDKKSKKIKEDASGEVESLILSVLSFAKWCGWDKELVDVAAKIKEAAVITDYNKIQS